MKASSIVIAGLIGLFSTINALGQGCIAVRHMSSVNPGATSADALKQRQGSKFQVTLGYRYLHSYKHFVGTQEQKQRVAEGTDVRNYTHWFDLGLNYQITRRLGVSVNLPYSYSDRSSLYEHYGNDVKSNPSHERFFTHSQGIGDLRLTANYWLINPAKLPKINALGGLGVKFPTGNSNYKDDFHKRDKDGKAYLLNKAVDQSLQLGDGGFGYSAEVQGYAQLRATTALYYNGFYLFSPKGVNATPLSVSDQFAARLGLSQSIRLVPGLALMLGGRLEGIPAIDAFGSSDGSRRPGYIVSVEPGVTYVSRRSAFSLSVPVAVVRNRIKSYSDRQDPTGQKHGDAAFADYFVSATVSRAF